VNHDWLYDFRHDARAFLSWGSQDDRVMGGESRSRLVRGAGGAVFEGVVSLEQGGGFASVRTGTLAPPLDLSQATAVVLRARGDGRRYKLVLRDDDGFRGPGFMAAFEAPLETGEVVLPFERFLPTWRGRPVPAVLDRRAVCSLGLMCSKFEPDGAVNEAFAAGPFRLEVEALGVLPARILSRR